MDPTASAGGRWRVGAGLADLVLGSRCAGCRRQPGAWCAACRALVGLPRPVMVVAGVPVVAAGGYGGPIGRAVVAHKEHGRLSLQRPLGRMLAGAVLALPGAVPDLVVPVPSRPSVVRQRGQDHARRLAASAAGVLTRSGAPVRAGAALQVVRPVRDQASLSLAGRRANVAGAFGVRVRWSGRVAGREVVVVDDVVTSGASLAAAVAALRLAGAHVVGCAVVAAASGQGPTGPADTPGARLA